MTQRTLKLHGTLTIACLGLLASMAGCLGDDSSEPPAHDGGTTDHAVTSDSPTTMPDTGSPRPDSSPDTSTTPDAGRDVSVGDGGTASDARDSATATDARDSATSDARDGASEGGQVAETGAPDAVADRAAETGTPAEAAPPEAAPPDAAPEAGPAEAAPPEAGPPEAAAPDAAPDAADLALHMCGYFDDAFGISQPDAGQCVDATPPSCPIDRFNTWSQYFLGYFAMGNINTDCRINGMFATLTTQDQIDFGNYLIAWNLAFLGCPDVTVTPPPLTYGLLPTPLASHTFTTADLRLISQYYIASYDAGLADAGLPALTQTQKDQMDAQLAALEQGVPNKVTASTYSFDSCAPDAGSD